MTGVDLEEKEVKLDNGQNLKYTHLVMAVGSNGPYPGRAKSNTKEQMEKDYSHLAEQVKDYVYITT